MANNRATKSGINRDLQQKINAKYDSELASQCMDWMKSNGAGETIGSIAGNQENLHEQLKDGFALMQ